jgi:hypothetical protein
MELQIKLRRVELWKIKRETDLTEKRKKFDEIIKKYLPPHIHKSFIKFVCNEHIFMERVMNMVFEFSEGKIYLQYEPGKIYKFNGDKNHKIVHLPQYEKYLFNKNMILELFEVAL